MAETRRGFTSQRLLVLIGLLLALAAASIAWVVNNQQQQAAVNAHLRALRPHLMTSLLPEDADYRNRHRQFRLETTTLFNSASSAADPRLQALLPWSRLLIEQLDRQLADSAALLDQLNHWSSLGSSELLASGELVTVASQLQSAGRYYLSYATNMQTLGDDIGQQLAAAPLPEADRTALQQLWREVLSHDRAQRQQRAQQLGALLVASGELFAFIAEQQAALQPEAMASASPEQKQQLAAQLRQHTSAMNAALQAWQQGSPAAPRQR